MSVEAESPVSVEANSGVSAAAAVSATAAAAKSEYSNTTLFVRNLPFDCENETLETLFSEFGPLRGCFVVKDPTLQGRNRGIGFVHFAVAGDAQRVLEAMERGDVQLARRPLQADWAHRKNLPVPPTVVKATTKKLSLVSAPVLVAPEKMEKCTALVLRMEQDLLADPKMIKALEMRLRRFSSITKLTVPYEQDTHRVLVEYPAAQQTIVSYRKLFSRVNTCIMTSPAEEAATKDKKKNPLFNRTCVLKAVEPVLPEPPKAYRLIVRNLPFSITRSSQLMDHFSPYGVVLDINVPTVENENTQWGGRDAMRGRGFAFVQFATRAEAEAAMAALNGTIVRTRPVAVDWALAKSVYDSLESGEKTSTGDGLVDIEGEEGEDVAGEEGENVAGEEDEEIDIEHDSDDDDDAELDAEESNASTVANAPDTEDEPSADDASASDTVFIRNLSYETDEDSLEEQLAERFNAEIEYCRIVRHPDTGASKGTAFVKFVDRRVAIRMVKIAEQANAPGAAQIQDLAETRTKRGFRSIVNDPDALIPGQEAGIVVDGRLLMVTFAVDRKEASNLGRQRALDKIDSVLRAEGRDHILDRLFAVPVGKTDAKTSAPSAVPRMKRNLALIHEALPEAADADKLDARELQLRQMVIQGRARSSANNANLTMSTTRLAVHHLPSRVTEQQLKEVMYAGVQEARKLALQPDNPLRLSKALLTVLRSFDTVSRVRAGLHQVKIILHRERKGQTEEDSGKGQNRGVKISTVDAESLSAKSRGYGFVEWRHPLMALLCVRWFRLPAAWTASGISKMIAVRARALSRDSSGDGIQLTHPVVEFATEKTNVLKRRATSKGAGKGTGKETASVKPEKKRPQMDVKRRSSNAAASTSKKVKKH